MVNLNHLWLLCLCTGAIACRPDLSDQLPQVDAAVETAAVVADEEADAADDPAIWVDSRHPERSMILGSNKTYGIETFDLSGKKLAAYEVGRVNNIDLRHGFPLNDSTRVSILGGSERTNHQILLFYIHPTDRSLVPLGAGIPSRLQGEVYGFCLYHHRPENRFFAFINDKLGHIEQWELTPTGDGKVAANWVRAFQVASQPEGMVADDKTGTLFVGEEMEGIWVFEALETAPGEVALPRRVPLSGEENPFIAYDIEGLAIYRSQSDSLLLASSQGNNSYAAFRLVEGYPYVGSFCVGSSAIDGSEETDGIEVVAAALPTPFEEGVFVAQDGYNDGAEGNKETQNFKLVPWKDVANALKQAPSISEDP